MPSNTFEHLGTTTISGSSTQTVTFSSFGGYERVILIAGAGATSASTLYCYVNGTTGGYSHSDMTASSTSSGNAIPVSSASTGQNYIYLDAPMSGSTNNNSAIYIILYRDGNGYTYVNGRVGSYNSTSAGRITLSNGYKNVSPTSFTFYVGNAFRAGSVFSAYGLS